MKTLQLGRASQNDIVINDSTVSTNHAQLSITNSGTEIIDLNSTNGTYVNGNKISRSYLQQGDTLKLGNCIVAWENYALNAINAVNDVIKTITIGRSKKCNIVVDYPNVSNYHAQILITKSGEKYIIDTNSTNCTYVNKQKISIKKIENGDVISLSNQHIIDWYTEINTGRKINAHLTKLISISAILAIIVGGVGFLFYKFNSFNPSQDYNNSVVIIYQSYLYEVSIGSKVFYVTKDDDQYVIFNEAKNSPISITGTGFIVTDDGEVITNRHVALPWLYNDDIEIIKKRTKDFLTQTFDSTTNLLDAIKLVDNITVSGKTVFLGIGYNNTFINSKSDFDECILKKESGDFEIDVACIQLKSKTIPTKVQKHIRLDEAMLDYKSFKLGDEVFMLGYPAGFTVGDTKEGLKVNFQKGQITREADNISVGHNIPTVGGGSGSPIFDSKGRLVAINHAGLSNTQGFNFAINAKHVIDLLK